MDRVFNYYPWSVGRYLKQPVHSGNILGHFLDMVLFMVLGCVDSSNLLIS